MAQPFQLALTDAERAELTDARDHHAKPYVRERAAALLKVSSGKSMRQVALYGLLRPHDPDTLRVWIRRYRQQGLAGLLIRSGRGRKPAFSPSLSGRAGHARGPAGSDPARPA
jgi:hypothetical protein